MAGIILIYTVLGGIKAVIYTDTVQWMVLLGGLFFFGVPYAYFEVGGWEMLNRQLPAAFFTLDNVSPVQLLNWFFTIIPIWFIAMTLYQRIYACRNTRDARRAFYIAGLLEYPLMSFLGVFLGMISRVFFPAVESEMGLPMLLRDVLPAGITGIVLAAFFSAIMSTADSCLIASSGNFVNDVIERHWHRKITQKELIRISQIVTLVIGLIALLIASSFATVLEIILHAYAFMVAGLFIPTLAAYFSKKPDSTAAFWSILISGGITFFLIVTKQPLPLELDASVFGILISVIIYSGIHNLNNFMNHRGHRAAQ
jgi:SSS family solute:Na+ symporter